ncbi:MAG: flagellum-specific ATP synthase FliI, partial [Sphingomonadales bacterium]
MSHSNALHRLLTAATVPALPLLRGGLVTGFDGTVLNACGLAVRLGDAVAVGRQRRPGEVIGFAGGTTQILGLANLAGVAPGDAVVPLPAASDVAVGPALLGRVIDGLGRPLDGRGPIMASARRPAQAPSLNPADRARVTQPLATGVKVLDGLLTFGQGQRIGIMAGTGVGKSVLLGQITRWADADVVVMALIGERGREITDFIETELNGPARMRTVTVAVPADEAPLLRLRGAERAFAIAEHCRDAGQRVLLILDSFSRVVMAARDIAFARGESSGGRPFPPSALSLLARLCERAG